MNSSGEQHIPPALSMNERDAWDIKEQTWLLPSRWAHLVSSCSPFPLSLILLSWIQWKQSHWGGILLRIYVFFPFSNIVRVTHLLLWYISTGSLWMQCIKQIIWAANNVVCIPVHKQGFSKHVNQWQKAAFQISLFKPCSEALIQLCQKSVEQIEVMNCWIPALWELFNSGHWGMKDFPYTKHHVSESFTSNKRREWQVSFILLALGRGSAALSHHWSALLLLNIRQEKTWQV